jgi:Protein prenyltransferase alpha subunit repeat
MGDDRGLLGGEWLPLHLRRELLDVVPLPLPHARVPVVEIDYSDQAREVLSYLRAFIALGEKSERALAITGEVRLNWIQCVHLAQLLCLATHSILEVRVLLYLVSFLTLLLRLVLKLAVMQAIHVNNADYTAWEFRWQCLAALDKMELYEKEIKFLEGIAADSPKNYQLWNLRRKLALKLGADNAEKVRHAEILCFVLWLPSMR